MVELLNIGLEDLPNIFNQIEVASWEVCLFWLELEGPLSAPLCVLEHHLPLELDSKSGLGLVYVEMALSQACRHAG